MSAPSDHPRDMLRELEPAVRSGLDRHLSASREWFPHEYVPYEVGRNYLEEPWDLEDSDLSPVARTALEINLLTEDNLPYYHLALWEAFGKEGPWGEWVRRWTAVRFLTPCASNSIRRPARRYNGSPVCIA